MSSAATTNDTLRVYSVGEVQGHYAEFAPPFGRNLKACGGEAIGLNSTSSTTARTLCPAEFAVKDFRSDSSSLLQKVIIPLTQQYEGVL